MTVTACTNTLVDVTMPSLTTQTAMCLQVVTHMAGIYSFHVCPCIYSAEHFVSVAVAQIFIFGFIFGFNRANGKSQRRIGANNSPQLFGQPIRPFSNCAAHFCAEYSTYGKTLASSSSPSPKATQTTISVSKFVNAYG